MNLLHISTVDAKKVLASLDEEEFGFSHGGRKRRRLENLSADERTLRRYVNNPITFCNEVTQIYMSQYWKDTRVSNFCE